MALGAGHEDVAAQQIRALLAMSIVREFVERAGGHEDAGLGGRPKIAHGDSGVVDADADEGGAIRFHILRHLGNIEAVLLGLVVQGVALVLIVTHVLVVAGPLHTAGDFLPGFGALGAQQNPHLVRCIPGLGRYFLSRLIPGSAAVGLAVFIDAGGTDFYCHILIPPSL